jgi:hypothetical protein
MLYKLKTWTHDDVATYSSASHIDVKSDPFAVNWDALVSNENTELFSVNLREKLSAIRTALQPIHVLIFPQWIMDRFKEALDQFTRGQWLSSISLCGDIVEFIVDDFWLAYARELQEKKFSRSKRVMPNLRKLLDAGLLKKDDYCRLFDVRKRRDDHVHNYLRLKFEGDYSDFLESNDVEVLRKLSEFFSKDNMEAKYVHYLDFALKRLSQTRRPARTRSLDEAVKEALKRREDFRRRVS